MNARVTTEVVELDPITRQRLILAGQIAAGVAAIPANWAGETPAGTIARGAWDIAGKLMSLAYSGGF